MPLKPDTQSAFNDWINSLQGKLTPQEFATMKATFNRDDVAEAIAPTVMMRADYGQQTLAQKREFEQKMADLEREAARLNEIDGQYAQWEQHIRTNYVPAEQLTTIQAEMNQLKAYRESTERKIKQLGVGELLDGLELDDPETDSNTGRTTMPQNSNPTNPTPPAAPFATQQMVNNKINEAALSTVAGVATLMRMGNEYRELTGRELPNPDQLIIEAVQAQRPIMDYIAEKFDFQKLRSDNAAAKLETEIQRRVKEEVAKQVSQHSSPVPGGMNQSPVVQQTVAAYSATADQRSQMPLFSKPGAPGRGANAAAEAFLSGKYRNGSFNPWTNG